MGGMRIKIQLSEPWDLGEITEWQPMVGELTMDNRRQPVVQGLINLVETIVYRDLVYRYIIATPRYEGTFLTDLLRDEIVHANLVGISDSQAESASPFDLRKWQNDFGMIGTLQASDRND